MRLLTWLSALLATNSLFGVLAAPFPQTLQDDLTEFLDAIPAKDIQALAEQYLKSRVKKRASQVDAGRLKDLGVDVAAIEQFVRDLFGSPK